MVFSYYGECTPNVATHVHVPEPVDRDLECEARSDGVDVPERPRVGLSKTFVACTGDAQEN